MWRYAERAGVLDTDMSRRALLRSLTAQYGTLVEHRRQAVPKQEAVPRLCGPVRPPAAHRAAPVPDNHPCFERTEEDKHVPFSEAIEAWRETDTLLMSWGNKASHSCIRST